jgi:hypothetical protein
MPNILNFISGRMRRRIIKGTKGWIKLAEFLGIPGRDYKILTEAYLDRWVIAINSGHFRQMVFEGKLAWDGKEFYEPKERERQAKIAAHRLQPNTCC